MLKYHPYKSDKPNKKYYIITNDNKKVYFGAAHSNENWSISGIDTAGWWSLKYLWSYPTKEEAYNHIKEDLKKWGVI